MLANIHLLNYFNSYCLFVDPEPITGINATNIRDTEITLMWASPRGEYNAFEVQYLTSENVLIQNLTLHNSITINDLKPHRNYTFTVVVRSGTESSILRRSLPISAIFTTKESFPGKVEKFEPVDIQPSDIIFEWSLPTAEQNGIIRKFTITYGLEVHLFTIIEINSYFIKTFRVLQIHYIAILHHKNLGVLLDN